MGGNGNLSSVCNIIERQIIIFSGADTKTMSYLLVNKALLKAVFSGLYIHKKYLNWH